jgi:dihydroorotase
MNEHIIKRPDDWHLHLRDGAMMRAVLPFTAELYARAIIMPNLKPPVITVKDAEAYRRRINDIFAKGLNPHMYCLPVAKRQTDRKAIRDAAVSGDIRFFFGSDSAPHPVSAKKKAGAAGIFNIPTAISHIAAFFEAEAALENLEAFMSLNGARFYGLNPNTDTITLKKSAQALPSIDDVLPDNDRVKVFQTDAPRYWYVARGVRKTSKK